MTANKVMFENIRLLYRFYGAGRGIFFSAYFWTAIFLALFVGAAFGFGPWYEMAHNTLPSLAGFSIAAFAIIFVVLKQEQITALLESKSDDDKPPLLSVASAICHAILVQIFTILLAGIVMSVDNQAALDFCRTIAPSTGCFSLLRILGWCLGLAGYFLIFYSWLLVLAAALSVLRMMALAGGVRR